MAEAVRAAGEDAGAPELLARVGRIAVPRGFWGYSDPGRLLAERFGAPSAETILAEFGVLQTTLVADACRAIAEGDVDVALVAGGDAKYRSLRAQVLGVEVHETVQADVAPTHSWRPHDALWAKLEWDRGLRFPVGYYALLESALRHHEGLSHEAHARELARLYEDFAEVARENPNAWRREGFAAEAIATPSDANPRLAFPYGKLHTSSWNVDQASALLFCSAGLARTLGLDARRFVHPLAATESNHMLAVSERAALHRSAAVEIAGARAFELAGLTPDAVERVDLYSCFPIAVRQLARGLGIPSDRRLTVTGGMPFAGGPVNNYVLQALARLVPMLREHPGEPGLVTAVSGMFTKQGFALFAAGEAPRPFAFEDCSEAVAAGSDVCELDAGYSGPARIAAYTVLHEAGLPERAIAICDVEAGRRTVAHCDASEIMAELMATEGCGRSVAIARDGSFAL